MIGQPIDVDLRVDVQIVDSGLDTGTHQRLCGVRKGAGEIEQDRDAGQRARCIRIGIEHPKRHAQMRSEYRQTRVIAPGNFEPQTQRFRPFSGHATGIAGGAVDQQCAHWTCCHFL
ncbi:hypothetical protein D3C84_914090 [compost metagenome]